VNEDPLNEDPLNQETMDGDPVNGKQRRLGINPFVVNQR
jgi:hypothetical protein